MIDRFHYRYNLTRIPLKNRPNNLKNHLHRSGFALIVSLMVLSLILLLVFVASSTIRVQIKSAEALKHRSLSKQNAKFALQQAISELQQELGPDLRVSANADLLNRASKNQNISWTGVWDASNYNPENPSSKPFRKWLVSHKDKRDYTSSLDPFKPNDSETVPLFPKLNFFADKVPVLDNEKNQMGSYAWGILDEGVKAKINIKNTFEKEYSLFSSGTQKMQKNAIQNISSQRYAFELLPEIASEYMLNKNKLQSLITLKQASLLDKTNPTAWIKNYANEVTTFGYSLLTNMRSGGLKLDLSRGLDNQFDSTLMGSRIFTLSDSLRQRFPDFKSPKWDLLKSYYNLYKKLDFSDPYMPSIKPLDTCKDESGNLISFLPQKEFEATNTLNGSILYKNGEPFDPTIHPIAPVVTQILLRIKLTGHKSSGYIKNDGDEITSYSWRISPQFVLWNPYNVRLAANNYRVHFDPAFQVEISADTDNDGTFETMDWRGIWKTNKAINSSNVKPLGNSKAEWFQMLKDLGFLKGWNSQFHLIMDAEFLPGEVKSFGLLNADYWKEKPHPNYSNYQYGNDGNQSMLWPEDFVSDQGTPVDNTVSSYGVSGLQIKSNPPPSTLLKATQLFEKIELSESTLESSDINYKVQGRFYLTVAPDEPAALSNSPGTIEPEAALGTTVRVGSAFIYQGGNKDFTFTPYNKVSEWYTSGLTNYPLAIFYSLKTTHGPESDLPIHAQFNPLAWHFTPNVKSEMHSSLWQSRYMNRSEWSQFYTQENPNSLTGYAKWGNELSDYGQKYVLSKEVPRKPLLSLGQLMHADIGMFDTSAMYTIGNSYAPPFSSNRIARTYSASEADYFGNEVHTLDWSWFYNDALFDTFFFSSIPSISSPSIPPYDEVEEGFVREQKTLPNGRLKFYKNGDEINSAYMDQLRDYHQASSKLWIDGGFNINSTNKTAWKLFLGSLNRNLSDKKRMDFYNINKKTMQSNASGLYHIMRLSNPMGEAVDKEDEIDNPNSWSGFRTLTPEELDALSETMIEEVRKRGPFLNLSEFVNRRLENSPLGDKGALQAALDKGINLKSASFQSGSPSATLWGTESSSNLSPDKAAGQPTWLLQNDLLQMMAPVINTRSDTFVIRSSGESMDPITGKILSNSICEAVLQRIPSFIEQDEEIADPAYKSVQNKFGRKFQIVFFRWIDPDKT